MCVLQTQTGHQVPLFAQLLVEAEVTGADRFVCFEVLAHFVVFGFLLKAVGIGQVEVAHIFFLYKVAYLVTVASHVSVAVFVLQMTQGVGKEGILVRRFVFVEVNPFVLIFVHYFGTEFQFVGITPFG